MKLPLWRLLTGWAVLGTLSAMLLSVAPVYVDNYRLARFLETADRAPDDAQVRQTVAAKAADLGLPVRPENIQIDRSAKPARIRVRYTVQKNLAVARLDLHLHAGDR